MTTGSWDPKINATSPSFTINLPLLRRFIDFSVANQLDDLKNALSPSEQQQYSVLMQSDREQWNIADDLENEEIKHLMRFFTVAEKLPGWTGNAQSPVIWLGKILKRRGVGIDKALQQWIKANSDNQFLPHGPLL